MQERVQVQDWLLSSPNIQRRSLINVLGQCNILHFTTSHWRQMFYTKDLIYFCVQDSDCAQTCQASKFYRKSVHSHQKYCYHVKHVYINIEVNQDRYIETLAVHLGRAWLSKVFQQAVVKTWAEAGTLRRILRCLGRTRGASWAPHRCHNHRQHYWPLLLSTSVQFDATGHYYTTHHIFFHYCHWCHNHQQHYWPLQLSFMLVLITNDATECNCSTYQ